MKKVLIIGNSAKEYAFAKKMSEICEVIVAPGSDTMKEFAQLVDIREDSTTELLEFVMENDIDLTIPCSAKSLNTNIVKAFEDNNQQIFAPSLNSMNITNDKASMKKILYKLRIPTPKFGIFEKSQIALDYIKNFNHPFVIKTNEPSSAIVLTSKIEAKTLIDSYYTKKSQKIIIEDYVAGTTFSFYAITDGYKALPFGQSLIYRHSLEGNGGQLTSGMGACSPNYKLSVNNEYFLMDNVIYPILNYLEKDGKPYVGILGVDGILTDDGEIQVIGLNSFMQDCDCQAVLEILDANLYELFDSCVIGSFSDEVEFIPQKNLSAVSLVCSCKNKDNKENIIEGLENLDDDTLVNFYPNVNKNRYLEYQADFGQVLNLTSVARTISSATSKVYDEVKSINFKGIYYRKDICKSQDYVSV